MVLSDQTEGVDGWEPTEITRNYRKNGYIQYNDNQFILVWKNAPYKETIKHMEELNIASFDHDYFFNNIYNCPIMTINKQYIPKHSLFQKLKLIFS